ncbi:hypothetical protein Barb6XT_01315 [Bacteroidales bacterium Barb6XT]|nr:hypothetical protein Barb6XT_01315 [Bacteroidales bacterium Barb6XT]
MRLKRAKLNQFLLYETKDRMYFSKLVAGNRFFIPILTIRCYAIFLYQTGEIS